jgi:hypothetical protein
VPGSEGGRQIGTGTVEVALFAAFSFILGTSVLILWGPLRGRMRGWLRIMAVVVGTAACALAVTVISVGVGWAVAVTFDHDEPSPVRTEQITPENQERTKIAEGVGALRRPPSGVRPPPLRLRPSNSKSSQAMR